MNATCNSITRPPAQDNNADTQRPSPFERHFVYPPTGNYNEDERTGRLAAHSITQHAHELGMPFMLDRLMREAADILNRDEYRIIAIEFYSELAKLAIDGLKQSSYH